MPSKLTMFSRLPLGTFSLRYHSNTFRRPELLVRVRGRLNAFDASALIDTGADRCCFPASVAGYIGIDLGSIAPFNLGTVGQPVRAWEHRVVLEFPELQSYSIDAEVWFVDNPTLNPLIGRDPLFSQIQLGFRQSLHAFYILTTA